jgi:putative oxidoreductase
MTALRSLARPMLSSIFVVQGLDTFQHPDKVARLAEPVVKPVAEHVAAVPAEAEQAVRLNGAIQVAAGTTLGLGVLPRLSALVLAGTLVPTTLAGHRFWEQEDPEERARQRIHFLKNVTIMGGLLIAAADTGGSPSLAWRRRKAARSAHRNVAGLQHALADSGRAASEQIAAASAATASSARTASDELSQLTQAIVDAARTAGAHLAELSQAAGESARKAGDQLPGAVQSARATADQVAHLAAGSARSAAESARVAAGQVTEAAQAAVEAGHRTARQLTSS